MIIHIQTLKEKYLRGWERQATVILLASALLLTLHRYYNRRSLFNRHFAEYFSGLPLPESHPYYYWFLTHSVYVVPCSSTRRKIWDSRTPEQSRISTRKPETGMVRDRRGVGSDGPRGYPCCYRVSAFRGKIPALQGSCGQLASIFIVSNRVWHLHVFVGILLSWVYAFRIGTEVRELQHFDPDDPVCGDALLQAAAGGTRFNCCGCIARCVSVGNAIIPLWRSDSLARRDDDGCGGCRFPALRCVKSIADARQLCYNS